jgi:hypothetical protein
MKEKKEGEIEEDEKQRHFLFAVSLFLSHFLFPLSFSFLSQVSDLLQQPRHAHVYSLGRLCDYACHPLTRPSLSCVKKRDEEERDSHRGRREKESQRDGHGERRREEVRERGRER